MDGFDLFVLLYKYHLKETEVEFSVLLGNKCRF